MGQIMAIDYGTKRCGVAVTDPLQTCAFGLDTIPSHEILSFLKEYMSKEEVVKLVVGEPKQRDNTASSVEMAIAIFIKRVQQQFPTLAVVRQDERFTSKLAHQTLIQGGAPKKVRQKKEVIDKISATLILQGYLEQHKSL